MGKYYIDYTCGNFTAPIEYVEKTKEEILDDILAEYPEFMQLAEYDSKDEAEKALSKYHDDITVQKNGDRAIINYHIYALEAEN